MGGGRGPPASAEKPELPSVETCDVSMEAMGGAGGLHPPRVSLGIRRCGGQFFLDRLTRIADRYPPRFPVELVALADMANTIMDGGIILSRVMRSGVTLLGRVTRPR